MAQRTLLHFRVAISIAAAAALAGGTSAQDTPSPTTGEAVPRWAGDPAARRVPLDTAARESLPLGKATRAAAPHTDGAADTTATPKDARLGGSVVQTIASLAIVIGIIGLLAVMVRKLARRSGGLMGAVGPGGRAPSGLLEVLGRYPIASGTTLILLKLDRRVLLISQTGGRGLRGGASLSTLSEISDPEDVASILIKARDHEGESLSHRFQAVLSSADRLTAEALEKQPVTLTPTVTAPKGRAHGGGGGGGAVSAIRSRLDSMRGGFSVGGDRQGRVA